MKYELHHRLGTLAKILEGDWKKYRHLPDRLRPLGWENHGLYPWLERPSETDPSYLVRLVMGTGNLVIVCGDTDIPEDVCKELQGYLREIENAITNIELERKVV